jgi:hypothetical protein
MIVRIMQLIKSKKTSEKFRGRKNKIVELKECYSTAVVKF